MKKIISVILCLGLLLSVCGCKEEQTPETEPSSTPVTTAPEETEPSLPQETTEPMPQYQLPLLSVSIPLINETFRANDGTALLNYAYQDISLILEDHQVADAIVIDFLNLVDPSGASISKVLRDAREDYGNADSFSAYTFKRVYSPMRLDAGVLSMYGTQTLSTAQTHNTTAGISVTYDLVTGQRLSLKQVLNADYSADALTKAIIKALSPSAEKGILYSDHAYVITEMFSTNTPIDNWYLSATGLCFYFAPYEIAPYSAGTIVAEVPYSELNGILKDVYFPPEEIELKGIVTFTDFSGADLDGILQFVELVLDEDGTEYLLHASGAVRNVRIEIGAWLSDGSFASEATLFAAATLCHDDALMLQLANSTLANIRITYESEGSVVSVPLTALFPLGNN